MTEFEEDQVSHDSLWHGRLWLTQPARGKGYRFNLDPVLLAGFVAPAAHILDLGAGCGIIGLLLLGLGRAQKVTAVEIQEQMAHLCRLNGKKNAYETARFEVLAGDLRAITLPPADGVVFNPPYVRAEAGRPAPNRGRDIARHERHGGLADFVHAGAEVLSSDGEMSVIVPISRGEELRGLFAEAGFDKQRTCLICAHENVPPRQLMLGARRGRKKLTEQTRLVVHDEAGEFTPAVRDLVAGPKP